MSNIFGLLGIPDFEGDRRFVNQIGQTIVYDAIIEEINRINDELNAALRVFVAETTEDHTRRYKLPGSGYMQERARLTSPGATKQTGYWDIALPLLDYGDQLASDDISMAYMSIRDLNLHLDTIQIRALNTTRRAILMALLNNTIWNFVDELNGTLAVQPLANGDSTLYPPTMGSETEAAENHYVVSGYAAASISDTNDPFPVIVNELAEHFGQSSQGDNIVVFFGNAHTAKIEGLTDFEPVNDRFIQPGANVNQVIGLPENLPGVVKGRHAAGAWAVEWRRLPANYLMAVHLDAPLPLLERVDRAETGLPRGLSLVSSDNSEFPLQSSFYRMRRGFGVGNRLNGVVMQLKSEGSFEVPTEFGR